MVPIIENTARECELTDRLRQAIKEYPEAHAVLVRRHGVYVWGSSWIQVSRFALASGAKWASSYGLACLLSRIADSQTQVSYVSLVAPLQAVCTLQVGSGLLLDQLLPLLPSSVLLCLLGKSDVWGNEMCPKPGSCFLVIFQADGCPACKWNPGSTEQLDASGCDSIAVRPPLGRTMCAAEACVVLAGAMLLSGAVGQACQRLQCQQGTTGVLGASACSSTV